MSAGMSAEEGTPSSAALDEDGGDGVEEDEGDDEEEEEEEEEVAEELPSELVDVVVFSTCVEIYTFTH